MNNGSIEQLQLKDLHIDFPVRSSVLRRRVGTVRAVSGVDLDLRAGQTVGIVGESGSGKSTLARAIVGIARATSGSILFDGEQRRAGRYEARTVQMVFQDSQASLNPRRSIVSQIADAWQFHPELARNEDRRRKAIALLDEVGIPASFADRLPTQLSGGQRQRVNIARALAVDPAFLVLDEPVASLDVSIQAQILNLLARLQADRGLGFLFISHDLGVVRRMADRIFVMYLGRVVELGATRDVTAAPWHPYTRALLSAARLGSEEHTAGRIILRGEVPSATNPPSGCRFRTRCWKAQDVCAQAEPAEIGTDGRHLAYCNFPENVEAGAEATAS